MPDIVKVCYASAKHHAGQHPVILITEQNYQEYATMPDYILQKVKNHEISLTHFSDMLRINLLKEHGGIPIPISTLAIIRQKTPMWQTASGQSFL